jgi:translation initiation factor IF-1
MDSDGQRGSGSRQVIAGIVTETLPSAMYRVRLEEGGRFVTAHIADRMERNFVRILVGDRVRIELTGDVTRGRIVEKL